MKSIILVVLLALAHNTLGKPNCRSEQEGNFQVYEPSSGKPIFISSASAEDEESAINTNDSDLEQSFELRQNDEHTVSHNHDNSHKVDCNCNKGKPKITYGPEQIVKGKPETYIHHQPKIVVRQPPTFLRIEHQPTVIEPSAIVFHRNGKTIRRPVIYQHLPQDVKVRPVIVKVVKPIEKKVLVEKKNAPCPKSLQQHKSHHDEQSLEYETQSYGGETYSELFDEQLHAHAHEHEHVQEHVHEHEHESFRSHLNVKETEQF